QKSTTQLQVHEQKGERWWLQGLEMKLTAIFQKVPEGYIGFVEELPGANTQAATLEEARANLAEAVELVLETNRARAKESIRGKDVIREPLGISHLARARSAHAAIRDVLLHQWDPIGVGDIPEAQDEYDLYVSQIYGLLVRREPLYKLIDF